MNLLSNPLTLATVMVHALVGRWWWRWRPARAAGAGPRRPGSSSVAAAGALAAVVVVVAVGGWVVWPPWGAAGVLIVPLAQRRRRARAEQRRVQALEGGVASLIVLLELCLHGGVSLRRALGDVSPWLPVELGTILVSMLRRVELGAGLADEFDRAAASHPALVALSGLVATTERYGAPIGPALAALAAEVRHEQRRRLERQARRVPLRLLAPLIGGVLPAFVLLSVVPMLAAALVNLRLGWV